MGLYHAVGRAFAALQNAGWACCKKKQLTNMRAAGSDEAVRLVPPRVLSLEQCLEYLADDELLEVTPQNLRMRKQILDHSVRMRQVMKNRQSGK